MGTSQFLFLFFFFKIGENWTQIISLSYNVTAQLKKRTFVIRAFEFLTISISLKSWFILIDKFCFK